MKDIFVLLIKFLLVWAVVILILNLIPIDWLGVMVAFVVGCIWLTFLDYIDDKYIRKGR